MGRPISRDGKDNLWSLALLLPTLIPLLIFWIYPMIKTFHISFTDWNYISPTFDYVKLENYKNLISDSFFAKVLKNTLVFTFFTVVPPILIGLFVAIRLNKIKALRNFFVATVFSSWITPTVVVSMVWVSIFDSESGIVNALLKGVGAEPVKWLGGQTTAMIVVIIVTIWQYTGLAVLLLSSALAKVDPEVEKANDLDGGKGLRKLLKITLPAISPILVFMFVFFTLNSLKAYDQIYILTQGGPSGATSTILYYFYVLAFELYETGPASALAMIFLVICLLISALNFFLSKLLFPK
ncbi:sugar ABC transporter permease [Brevibacillus choshinensis]|uniref:carbohydrate ABC transporter permease n=1 Tax=Brevibacillus choshinensis TaxID=54911 RepID=UPI002E22CE47|nr:sugar ABC transporter permease [Brevibacillus choshinensis]MED4753656.1 sugar ABC transporter permease [Brevibacillus choshinensis]MED4781913.1 sugar ABC transporter permease [Brevibacillus choshinensis]